MDRRLIKTSKFHVFYLSANGVWLTDQVPAQYIDSDGSRFHDS